VLLAGGVDLEPELATRVGIRGTLRLAEMISKSVQRLTVRGCETEPAVLRLVAQRRDGSVMPEAKRVPSTGHAREIGQQIKLGSTDDDRPR
jgi:hypothetical protein